MADVASLVREARERAQEASSFATGVLTGDLGYTVAAKFAGWYGVDMPLLCDALEERGREVERLREQARLREIDYWNLVRERDELQRELQKLRHYMSIRMVVFSDYDVGPISLLDEYERAVEDGFFAERGRR